MFDNDIALIKTFLCSFLKIIIAFNYLLHSHTSSSYFLVLPMKQNLSSINLRSDTAWNDPMHVAPWCSRMLQSLFYMHNILFYQNLCHTFRRSHDAIGAKRLDFSSGKCNIQNCSDQKLSAVTKFIQKVKEGFWLQL